MSERGHGRSDKPTICVTGYVVDDVSGDTEPRARPVMMHQ
jgi:hypothetical protein